MAVTIYMHTSPSGKHYIGQTTAEPEKRWAFGYGYRTCVGFHNAIEKYGWNNIKHEILFEGVNSQYANRLEQVLIGMFRTTNTKYGYNILQGGNNHSMPDSVKQKISKANKGKKKPPGFGEMLAERQNGKPSPKSERGTQNIIEGIMRTHAKPVLCVETGNVYPSVSEAARQFNCDPSCICKVCNGKKHTTHGYHWQYYEGGEDNVGNCSE